MRGRSGIHSSKRQSNARLLADADGIVSHHQFFLSARPFAQQNGEVLAITMDEVGKEGVWVRGHYSEAAAQLAPIQGLDANVIEAGLRHYAHIYKSIDAGVLAQQQRIADTFSELRIIPTKIVTKDAALQVQDWLLVLELAASRESFCFDAQANSAAMFSGGRPITARPFRTTIGRCRRIGCVANASYN